MNKTLPANFREQERQKLGLILKHNREQKGISIAELSEATGLDERMLDRLEDGKIQYSVDKLTLISFYLDYKVGLYPSI